VKNVAKIQKLYRCLKAWNTTVQTSARLETAVDQLKWFSG